ncbi:hypothetical protein [Glaciihabitans sp. UYNi722]|uniref:hypothetical protein n=1 Tax=Glaciihabitans sp. UYNi722 TaxID=3156344 RepID=UPI003390FE8D
MRTRSAAPIASNRRENDHQQYSSINPRVGRFLKGGDPLDQPTGANKEGLFLIIEHRVDR